MSFINRDWVRTEGDDFKLHVEDVLKRDATLEALEVRQVINGEELLLGWKIQTRYE
jgi:hypothetical protein